ncbi:hypothetical protein ACWGIR_23235 [Streptomyces albidoflavus]
MGEVTGAARDRQTATALVALLQSVARLVGPLQQSQWDAARLATEDAREALHGLALLLGDYRASETDAGPRLAEHLAEHGYPIPAVEMLGQGSYEAFHAVMTLRSGESADASMIGKGLEVLSDDELERLRREQSGPEPYVYVTQGDVRSELLFFRQMVDSRAALVRHAADEGLSEVETARLIGLSRNTVRSLLGKGARAPKISHQASRRTAEESLASASSPDCASPSDYRDR